MERLRDFLTSEMIEVPGALTPYKDVCAEFTRWLHEDERAAWPKRAIGRALDSIGVVRGTRGPMYVANLVLRRFATVFRRTENGELRREPL